jgi:hypothetical protein
MSMPDKSSTSYADEINQPIHKPGMAGTVNRGAMASGSGTMGDSDPGAAGHDLRDANGTRLGERRTASPPTQSAFGPASASDPAPAAPASPPKAPDPDSAVGVGGKARETNVMGQVDAAVKG